MGIAGIAVVVAAALAAGNGEFGVRASAMPATVPGPPAGERAARAMKRIIGWKWAGNWSGARDYQHFSASGH